GPAEAHFLRMYRYLYEKILPGAGTAINRPDERLKEALTIRMLAERAAVALAPADPGEKVFHPYAEQVFRWVQSEVDKGDEERRLGEDRRFGPGKELETSREHFTRAKDSYERANKTAAIVRRAYALRDRLLAALPFFAHSAARRRDWLDENDK